MAGFIKDSSTCVSGGSNEEDAAYAALQSHETIFKFYVATISRSTGGPMLHLKQHGDFTPTDVRACINHYESAADVCCTGAFFSEVPGAVFCTRPSASVPSTIVCISVS